MPNHHCDAIALLCMDWRLYQSGKLFEQVKEIAGISDFDIVSLAGATKNLVDEPNRELILRHFELSKNLHQAKRVILTNHTDCGAYGQEGTEERLIDDLKKGGEIIKEKFPELDVILILIRLLAGENQWEIKCEVVE